MGLCPFGRGNVTRYNVSPGSSWKDSYEPPKKGGIKMAKKKTTTVVKKTTKKGKK